MGWKLSNPVASDLSSHSYSFSVGEHIEVLGREGNID
jgi:hypothetical protein